MWNSNYYDYFGCICAERCSFPVRWEGNWFQSGFHQTLTITRHGINAKGKCLEADGEKFVVYNEYVKFPLKSTLSLYPSPGFDWPPSLPVVRSFDYIFFIVCLFSSDSCFFTDVKIATVASSFMRNIKMFYSTKKVSEEHSHGSKAILLWMCFLVLWLLWQSTETCFKPVFDGYCVFCS